MQKGTLPEAAVKEIENILGYSFSDKELLKRAFVHSSAQIENQANYERLEFLGDAVLQLSVTDYLMKNYKEMNEGELTRGRSKIVSRGPISAITKKLNLDKFMITSSTFNERGAGTAVSEKMKCDLFEAVCGAVFRDGGMEKAVEFILKNLTDVIESTMKGGLIDGKSELLEFCAKNKLNLDFKVEEKVKNGKPYFYSKAIIEGKETSSGEGETKRASEKDCSKKALEILKGNEYRGKY